MTETIWKTELEVTDEQDILVPEAARFLHVADQGGKLCLWFKCNPDLKKRRRSIVIVGTGHPMPGWHLEHIGSALCGAFVWHVFEVLS